MCSYFVQLKNISVKVIVQFSAYFSNCSILFKINAYFCKLLTARTDVIRLFIDSLIYFYRYLPIFRLLSSVTALKEEAMTALKSPQKFVYIADDDEDDRMLFLDALMELDLPMAVKEAEDGQQLLNTLYGSIEELPEIIFLDINMPGRNGFDCLKEIRSEGRHFKDVKVVMLSTSRSQSNIDLSYELGADFYAVKPSTFQGLKRLLEKIFEIDWSSFTKKQHEFLLF